MSRLAAFAADRRAGLAWNAVVLTAVFLPLCSLAVDLPEYYAAAAHLEMALEAAAQDAANQCMQLRVFSLTGNAALDADCVRATVRSRFDSLTQGLAAAGRSPKLSATRCGDSCLSVSVEGSLAMEPFFGLAPPVSIRRTAVSRARMTGGES